MFGVDKLDQMGTYYSFLHKSLKWWRKVFFWLLEATTVNSYILYKSQHGTSRRLKELHLTFRRSLILSLAGPLSTSSAPRVHRATHGLERLRPVQHFLIKGRKRVDCSVCSERDCDSQRHLTLYKCETCTDTPALCPGECFKKYHTLKNYK